MTIDQQLKWDQVYETNPKKLPWYGKQFPTEVRAFLADLSKEEALIVSGCGAGDTVALLNGQGFTDAIGTDISAKAISVAHERFPQLKFKQIPTQNLYKHFVNVNVFDWINMHQVSHEEDYE